MPDKKLGWVLGLCLFFSPLSPGFCWAGDSTYIPHRLCYWTQRHSLPATLRTLDPEGRITQETGVVEAESDSMSSLAVLLVLAGNSLPLFCKMNAGDQQVLSNLLWTLNAFTGAFALDFYLAGPTIRFLSKHSDQELPLAMPRAERKTVFQLATGRPLELDFERFDPPDIARLHLFFDRTQGEAVLEAVELEQGQGETQPTIIEAAGLRFKRNCASWMARRY